MQRPDGETRHLARAQYERLRVILSQHGYDPELAMEDEGHGIGVGQPEGVRYPPAILAQRYIEHAVATAELMQHGGGSE
jgi:hypothetical protein